MPPSGVYQWACVGTWCSVVFGIATKFEVTGFWPSWDVAASLWLLICDFRDYTSMWTVVVGWQLTFKNFKQRALILGAGHL